MDAIGVEIAIAFAHHIESLMLPINGDTL